MLELTIEPREYYDEIHEVFVEIPGATIQLEHSLVSLSKWESFYEKPFLTDDPRTEAETLYYVECMLLKPIPDNRTLSSITSEQALLINEYINKKHTATWFTEQKQGRKSSEVITSELIYYWMVTFNIPFVCETWNLNRLLTLIRVVNIKNQPPKKMDPRKAAMQAREINRQRREAYNTTG